MVLGLFFIERHGPRVQASIVGSLGKATVVDVFSSVSFFAGGWVEGVVACVLGSSNLPRGEIIGVRSIRGV